MKLWFVIYVGTQIGGSWGPLPYDLDECTAIATKKNVEWQERIATGKDLKGNPVSEQAKAMHFGCLQSPQRPKNEVKP